MKVRTRALLAISFAQSLALAATPSEEADRLFREAIALRDQDDIAGACAKFSASQKLESSSGTLLNVGQCHETFGRFASARTTYTLAKEEAAKRNRIDHSKKADERLRAIEGKVASVVFDKTSITGINGVRVLFDGAEVTASELPVDPGPHVLEVNAPDYEKSVLRIEIEGAQHLTVPVPKPNRTGNDRQDSKKVVPPPPAGKRNLVPAILVGGAGVLGLGFGVVSTVIASGALADAKAACPTYPTCGPEAQEPNDKAQQWSTISTVSFIAGGALVVGGVVLYLVAKPSATVSVSGTGQGANLTFKYLF